VKIRYYISGHGLGHASRSCQVINTLRRRHPEIAVEVVSDAHSWFFAGFLDPAVPVRRRRLDLGVLQRGSLVMEEEATLRAYRRFLPERERAVAEEAASLRREGVSLVVADIPPAAFAAAKRAGLPAVALGNFSWDWIYEDFALRHRGYGDVLVSVREDYAGADLLLRLPFHGEFPAFSRIEDLPLVVRRGSLPPAEVRARLGIPVGRRVGLLSFGGFGLEDFDFSGLAKLQDWTFLSGADRPWTGPNLQLIPQGLFAYPDLVRASDVVVTKPGYGIVSEAIANGTAVLYTPRGDFREQEVLVAALKRYARCREIDNAALLSGRWGASLEALLAQPGPREPLALDGDLVAAERLAQLAGGVRA